MIELFECGHFQKTGSYLTSKRERERCCDYCAVYSCVLCPGSQTLEQADLVLYGHTARVWDGFLLSDCIISAGEVREVPLHHHHCHHVQCSVVVGCHMQSVELSWRVCGHH